LVIEDSSAERALTPSETAEAARILCALIRREMTLPEALRALPGRRRKRTTKVAA
jgi:hypothetical protein